MTQAKSTKDFSIFSWKMSDCLNNVKLSLLV